MTKHTNPPTHRRNPIFPTGRIPVAPPRKHPRWNTTCLICHTGPQLRKGDIGVVLVRMRYALVVNGAPAQSYAHQSCCLQFGPAPSRGCDRFAEIKMTDALAARDRCDEDARRRRELQWRASALKLRLSVPQ